MAQVPSEVVAPVEDRSGFDARVCHRNELAVADEKANVAVAVIAGGSVEEDELTPEKLVARRHGVRPPDSCPAIVRGPITGSVRPIRVSGEATKWYRRSA